MMLLETAIVLGTIVFFVLLDYYVYGCEKV